MRIRDSLVLTYLIGTNQDFRDYCEKDFKKRDTRLRYLFILEMGCYFPLHLMPRKYGIWAAIPLTIDLTKRLLTSEATKEVVNGNLTRFRRHFREWRGKERYETYWTNVKGKLSTASGIIGRGRELYQYIENRLN